MLLVSFYVPVHPALGDRDPISPFGLVGFWHPHEEISATAGSLANCEGDPLPSLRQIRDLKLDFLFLPGWAPARWAAVKIWTLKRHYTGAQDPDFQAMESLVVIYVPHRVLQRSVMHQKRHALPYNNVLHQTRFNKLRKSNVWCYVICCFLELCLLSCFKIVLTYLLNLEKMYFVF